jgi:signal transduction histidine kinase
MFLRAKLWNTQKLWQRIFHPQPVSLEYRQWRERLIRKRFWLAIGLAVIFMIFAGLAEFYEFFINPEALIKALERNRVSGLLGVIRQKFFLHKITLLSLLGCLILVWKTQWGRQHPRIMFVLIPWAIAFIPEMVLGAFVGLPGYPSTTMFMGQAVIAPAFWRLHLLAQIVPIAFYFLVYPLLGLAKVGERSIYSFSYTVEIILVCVICEVGVYLYEQSKQSELEANRQLQLFIHSITHDLRTPVMGSLMLLESIRQNTPKNSPIEVSQFEMGQLIQGNDRLLGLMDSLLVPQAFSQANLLLDCQPTQLSTIVTIILQNLHPSLVKQNIQVDNQITSKLALVEADPQQLGRVFHNLISNAISHNPPGILLTLDAVQSQSMLKVIVQDNGVGISPSQQEIIFEPYTRGENTRYLPGLGLGLHICRQIVQAHGGKIGVTSSAQYTVFWFTLPLSGVVA